MFEKSVVHEAAERGIAVDILRAAIEHKAGVNYSDRPTNGTSSCRIDYDNRVQAIDDVLAKAGCQF